MAIFKGEELCNGVISHLSQPLSADQSLSSYVLPAGDPWSAIVLTAGDMPLIRYIDKDGTPHIAVFRDSDDTLVIRS